MYQRQVSFSEAITRALKFNYCNFDGRASRSEYWWFCLFGIIIGTVITIIFGKSTFGTVINGAVSLGLLLPSLGLAVRRLHDIGKSGWYYFLIFIPLVGGIILLIWFCKDSQKTPNEYGPVPNVVA